MQVIRNIAWVVVTALLVAFIAMNWTPAAVNFWPLENGNYLHFNWPIGLVALLFFILGMLPVVLYLRAVRWRLNRRITSLENTLRSNSGPVVPAAIAPDTALASEPVTILKTPSEPLQS